MSHAEKNRKKRVLPALLILLMVAAGPVLIGIGVVVTVAEEELARTGLSTEGTVGTVRDGVKASRQRFEVDYLAEDGTGHSLWVSWSTAEKPVEGELVTVVYDGTDPEHAIVEGYDGEGVSLTGIGVVLTVVFGVVGIIGLASFLRRRARGRVNAPSTGH